MVAVFFFSHSLLSIVFQQVVYRIKVRVIISATKYLYVGGREKDVYWN